MWAWPGPSMVTIEYRTPREAISHIAGFFKSRDGGLHSRGFPVLTGGLAALLLILHIPLKLYQKNDVVFLLFIFFK